MFLPPVIMMKPVLPTFSAKLPKSDPQAEFESEKKKANAKSGSATAFAEEEPKDGGLKIPHIKIGSLRFSPEVPLDKFGVGIRVGLKF